MDQRHLHSLELPLSIASFFPGDEQIWDGRRHFRELTKKRFARNSQDRGVARCGVRCALPMRACTHAHTDRHALAQMHARTIARASCFLRAG